MALDHFQDLCGFLKTPCGTTSVALLSYCHIFASLFKGDIGPKEFHLWQYTGASFLFLKPGFIEVRFENFGEPYHRFATLEIQFKRSTNGFDFENEFAATFVIHTY